MKTKLDLQVEQDWCLEYKERANRRAERTIKKGLKKLIPIAIYVAISLIFPVAKWFIVAGGILTLLPLAANIFSYLIYSALALKYSVKANNLQKQIDEIEQCELFQQIFDESSLRIERKKNLNLNHNNNFNDENNKTL